MEKMVICQRNLPTLQLNALVVIRVNMKCEQYIIAILLRIHLIGGQTSEVLKPCIFVIQKPYSLHNRWCYTGSTVHHTSSSQWSSNQGLPVLHVGWSALLRGGCIWMWPLTSTDMQSLHFSFTLMMTGAFSQLLFSKLKVTTDNLHLSPTCWEDAKMLFFLAR